MTWSRADMPDQSGRVAVVTGANGGLGLATAEALAGAGAHVVMAARDQDKAASAHDAVLAAHPDASLEVVPLDLGDLASVEACVDEVRAAHDRVDLLVNNAGVMALPERRTADDFEMQFGVNHLGHWVLTARLLPTLLAAAAPRVVTVTSFMRHLALPVTVDDPHLRDGYGPWRAYNQSKLANFHFALGLQRVFDRAGVRAASLAAHPGLTNSDLQSHTAEQGGTVIGRLSELVARATGMSIRQGALPQLRAATDPRARGGQLYGPRLVSTGWPVRLPVLRTFDLDRGIDRLWEVSERETGVALDGAVVRAAAGAA